MGISIKSVYDNVRQQIGKENGEVFISEFNENSKRAENRLLGYVTGNIAGNMLPQMYITQKDKDFVAPFITTYKDQLTDGKLQKPADYFLYENLFGITLDNPKCIGGEDDGECGEEDEEETVLRNAITLLNGDEFNIRTKTRIKGLIPRPAKAIAKEVGTYFEFEPQELPVVTLEYVRYPVYARAVMVLDATYNEMVIDEVNSINYEWDEKARELLVSTIVWLFSISNRDGDLLQMNATLDKDGK